MYKKSKYHVAEFCKPLLFVGVFYFFFAHKKPYIGRLLSGL